MSIAVDAIQESCAKFLADVEVLAVQQRNLSDVARWAVDSGRKDIFTATVTQDEFTHDVVVRYEGDVHLVYDVT